MEQNWIKSEAPSTHAFVHDVLGVMRPSLSLVAATDQDELERRTPEPRQRTTIHAVMSGRGIPAQDVIIRNVSSHGMCIAPQVAIPDRGEIVYIHLPSSLRLSGEVCWSDGKQFGIQLDQILDIDNLVDDTKRRVTAVSDTIDRMVEHHFQSRNTTRLLHVAEQGQSEPILREA